MPLFGFVCTQCDTEQELLVRTGDTPVCEACGSEALEKQMSRIMPLQGGAKRSEPVGCGASQCCQLQNGGCPLN